MQQVVDLEGHTQFQALDVQMLSISIDPIPDLAQATRQWGVKTPHLFDRDSKVSQLYDVLKWAMPSGEPGHTFVLVGKGGRVKWIRDYGARGNGGLMNVPVANLLQEVSPWLK